MGQTKNQTVAVGAFDAQTVVERLEPKMTELRFDVLHLK
jgi:hypothetical protein